MKQILSCLPNTSGFTIKITIISTEQMWGNALTIKNLKTFNKMYQICPLKPYTANWQYTINYSEREKLAKKLLHPRLCSSKSPYSTPSAPCQSQRLLCAQECSTTLIPKSRLGSIVGNWLESAGVWRKCLLSSDMYHFFKVNFTTCRMWVVLPGLQCMAGENTFLWLLL